MLSIKQEDGTSINLRDLQLVSLEMLYDFHEFCERYDIKYTLCGGCCIGALRHQGFIPWDDDVDVHMFRKDYDLFYKLWLKYGNKDKYNLVKTTKTDYQNTKLTQISLKESTFIKKNLAENDIDHGIKLEIIPLDGAPTNKYKRKLQIFWATVFYLFNRGFVPENRGKFVALTSKIVLTVFRTPKMRYPIWRFAEKQMIKYPVEESEYVTELYVTSNYMKIDYPKEIFIGSRKEKFEDGMFYVPYKAEEYLEMAFGDFMNMPPLENRVPKHDTTYIDLHKSFLEYKGIYYLKKG